MTEALLDRRRWVAPPADGTVWSDPTAERFGELIAANRAFDRGAIEIHGRNLADLAAEARRELLTAALAYTQTYRSVSPALAQATADGPIYLTGHQAEMFHPGVWAKNAFLARLAARDGAAAVHVVVDSDLLKHASIAVPGGTVAAPERVLVPFDLGGVDIPLEERPVQNLAMWETFGTRAADVLRPLVGAPVLHDYWPKVLARTAAGQTLGLSLAQARHQLEGDWGLASLEVPLSQTCRFQAFHWFVAALAAEPLRVKDAYNRAIVSYRRTHHVRSRNHPAPFLIDDGAWCELPLWVWSASDSRRRRLFARQAAGETQLTDREGWSVALPLTPEGTAERAVTALAELAAQGVKIRTRALATTLWMRLFLSDLFLHGIGGAKYDQAADQFSRELFGSPPPGYGVVTGTLRLPIERPRISPTEVRRIAAAEREILYHPERFLPTPTPEEATALVAEKRRWIAMEVTPATARERCRAIRRINAALQTWVAEVRAHLAQERVAERAALGREALLGSREYSFPLYPRQILENFLLAIVPASV